MGRPEFSDLDAFVAIVRHRNFRRAARGILRLNVPGAAQPILAPLVARFLEGHPGIRLEITVDNNFVDVFAEGFDAGIRYDESLALDMIALPIGPAQRYAVVASPDHVRRHGAPERPEDLLTRPCLRHRFLSGAMLPWEFEKDGQVVKIDAEAVLVTNSPDIAIRAAEDGLGWYATFESFVRPSLDAGRLVEALPSWCPYFPGPSLYYPSRRHMPAPLRAFIDFVQAGN